jgi:hypothetical protein
VLRKLLGGQLAPRLEDEEEGDEPARAHVRSVIRKDDRR